MQSVFEILIFGLAILSSCGSTPTKSFKVDGHLEFANGDYLVDWELDEERTTLTLDLTVLCQGWFGIGFSVTGNMVGADMAVTQVTTNEEGVAVLELRDYHSVTSNNVPILDVVQNLEDVRAGRNETHSYAHFTRPLNTGDPQDLILNLDGIYIIYAFSENIEEMEYHRQNRGQELVVFDSSK